jgi:hypothetical protein
VSSLVGGDEVAIVEESCDPGSMPSCTQNALRRAQELAHSGEIMGSKTAKEAPGADFSGVGSALLSKTGERGSLRASFHIILGRVRYVRKTDREKSALIDEEKVLQTDNSQLWNAI